MHKLFACAFLLSALSACGTRPTDETLRMQTLTWAQATEQMGITNGSKIVRVNGVIFLQ